MAILTSADYPEVRSAIDVQLNSQLLPDTIIAYDLYHDAAERDVLDRDPDAETRTGVEADRIRRACIYFLAARLCPIVVRITSISVQTHDVSYSKPVFDPDERAAQLKAMAEEELAEVLTPTETAPQRPTMFATASGVRGW